MPANDLTATAGIGRVLKDPPRVVPGGPGFQELSRKPLVDQAVDQLRDMILSGEIPPRTRLLQEQVAAQLGVSRTPLREAIRVLVHEGLLTPVAGGGSVEVVELTDEDARDLYEVREVIDGLAARLCTARRTELPLDVLERDLEELRAAADPVDTRRFLDAHSRFHIELVRACGNKRLTQTLFIVQMSSIMLFPRLAESPERMRASAEEHADILGQIKAGDVEQAERLARQHIKTASSYWLDRDDGA